MFAGRTSGCVFGAGFSSALMDIGVLVVDMVLGYESSYERLLEK